MINWTARALIVGMAIILSTTINLTTSIYLSIDSIDKKDQGHLKGKEGTLEIQVPPPPFSEDIFPCSQCHAEQEPNPQRRQLEMHEDIQLNHGQQNRWCLDCHDAANRDMLHLADGELLDFKKSYRLCGQCHGPKLRDWRQGIHGKRTGFWNGRKEYLLCVHCHNPHSPRFQKIEPEPPPRKPGNIKQ